MWTSEESAKAAIRRGLEAELNPGFASHCGVQGKQCRREAPCGSSIEGSRMQCRSIRAARFFTNTELPFRPMRKEHGWYCSVDRDDAHSVIEMRDV